MDGEGTPLTTPRQRETRWTPLEEMLFLVRHPLFTAVLERHCRPASGTPSARATSVSPCCESSIRNRGSGSSRGSIPLGTARDPAKNVCIDLPQEEMASDARMKRGRNVFLGSPLEIAGTSLVPSQSISSNSSSMPTPGRCRARRCSQNGSPRTSRRVRGAASGAQALTFPDERKRTRPQWPGSLFAIFTERETADLDQTSRSAWRPFQ